MRAVGYRLEGGCRYLEAGNAPDAGRCASSLGSGGHGSLESRRAERGHYRL